ncbi:MAG: DUF421 domain-containing protein [Bacillota bacterium]
MQDWLAIFLHSIFLFFITLALVRAMGKRQPARMAPFRFVNYVVVAVLTALIATDIITNPVFSLLALGVWTLLPIALDFLAMKSKWIHDWLDGEETVLIKRGKILGQNMMKAGMTGAELLRELRSKNAFNVADVEFAVMEPAGDINVFLKSDKKPLTAHDLGIKVSPQAEPQTVIMDGNILNDSLADLGLNREWLHTQLESLGVSLENVFLGQADSSGDLYVDLFDDQLQAPRPKTRELIYANLERCHADLMKYALETPNQDAKNMYGQNAEKLQRLMQRLKPYLLH